MNGNMSRLTANLICGDTHVDTSLMESIDEAMLVLNEEDSYRALNDLSVECELLTEAYHAGTMDMEYMLYSLEDVQIGANSNKIVQRQTTGIISRIQAYIDKIITWLSNTIDNFISNISNTLTDNENFIRENNATLRNLPQEVVADITLQVIPYWNYGIDQLLTAGVLPYDGKMQREVEQMIQNPTGFFTQFKQTVKSFEDIAARWYPQVMKFDRKDWKHAVQMFYLNGNEPATQQFQNQDAQQALIRMCDYMTKYRTYVEYARRSDDAAKRLMQKIRKELDQLRENQNRLNQQAKDIKNWQEENNARKGGGGKKSAVTASAYYFPQDYYSALEGKSLKDTEFATMLPTYEAGFDVTNTAGTSQVNTQPVQDIQKPEGKKGKVRKALNKQAQQNQQQTKENDASLQAASTANKAIQLLAYLAGQRLSIVKQIADHYRTIMNQVMNALRTYNQNTAQSRQNQQYNDQQRQNLQRKRQEEIAEIKHNKEKDIASRGLLGRIKGRMGN